MKLILNGVNGRYLREITENAKTETEYVEAAVAYASKEDLLFDWCLENKIRLQYWGRFDATVPVSVRILRKFLDQKSPNYTCKLLTHFHAKVIWWHGYGAYIGSANLSDPAWNGNIEAGCFFPEIELEATGIDQDLHDFFRKVDEHSTPLGDELFRLIEKRAGELQGWDEQDRTRRNNFLSSSLMHKWDGLLNVTKKSANERRRREFLDEWHSTLQILRDIGNVISRPENRPRWLKGDVPEGAQADQFLHAHYYHEVIVDRRSLYAEKFEENRGNPGRARSNTISWWRALPSPPTKEDQTLFQWAPFLREHLSQHRILALTLREFTEVCSRVWSIQDHARRMANAELNLSGDRRQPMEIKVPALARYLYARRSPNGSSVLQVIHYVLYGGREEALPERLWEATSIQAWKIPHFGISALGEVVGWALPNQFPPRNNRTSKSLRALGYPVDVHR